MTRWRHGAVVILELATATLVLVIAAYYSIDTRAVIVDPDIWWHIRVGDWIAEHRTLPRTGILSQHVERSWVAYSWGFDLLVSTVHRFYGLAGIFRFAIGLQVVISLAFLLAIRHIARLPWWSLVVAALSIYAFYIEPLRPVLLTLMCFILELFVIMEAERRGDDKLLRWMGPLFFLWANLHIQFTYGLFVLGLYVATRLFKLWRSGDIERAPARNRLLGGFVLAAACSCIGPNGILPHMVALNYVVHPIYYQTIQELAAINFRRPEHYVQLLLLMAACFALGRRRRSDIFRPLLLIVTAFIAFRSTRDSWFVAIASGFVLAEAIGKDSQARLALNRAEVVRPSVLYSLAAVMALVISSALASRQGVDLPAITTVVDRVYPLRAVEFVEGSNLMGPMYNDFNWGGFLIFRLPSHPVSIDPRADLYGEDLFAQSLRTTRAETGWQKDPDLARANFILLPRGYPLETALANDGHFRRVYEDHIAVVLVRQSPPQ